MIKRTSRNIPNIVNEPIILQADHSKTALIETSGDTNSNLEKTSPLRKPRALIERWA
jgi:hypothetical protein